MIKDATTKFDILEIIKKRWSPRSFSQQKIHRDQIEKLVDAAHWAASSFNEQPWRFIAGIKGDGNTYEKLFDCMVEWNQNWAKTAPALMLICSKKTFSHNEKENRHFAYDTGQAAATMALQAVADGFYIHQMGGFSKTKAISHFNLPENIEPMAMAAIGYLGDPYSLNNEYQNDELSKRRRKPISDLLFEETWGQSF